MSLSLLMVGENQWNGETNYWKKLILFTPNPPLKGEGISDFLRTRQVSLFKWGFS